jgi:hypothetical protein
VALRLGALGFGLLVIGLPLAGLAHQLTYSGLGAFVILPPFAIVGFVLARRVPRNPIGWSMLVPAVMALLGTDAGFYAVRAVRLGDHGLPLARLAVFLAAGWLWLILLLPIALATSVSVEMIAPAAPAIDGPRALTSVREGPAIVM